MMAEYERERGWALLAAALSAMEADVAALEASAMPSPPLLPPRGRRPGRAAPARVLWADLAADDSDCDDFDFCTNWTKKTGTVGRPRDAEAATGHEPASWEAQGGPPGKGDQGGRAGIPAKASGGEGSAGRPSVGKAPPSPPSHRGTKPRDVEAATGHKPASWETQDVGGSAVGPLRGLLADAQGARCSAWELQLQFLRVLPWALKEAGSLWDVGGPEAMARAGLVKQLVGQVCVAFLRGGGPA